MPTAQTSAKVIPKDLSFCTELGQQLRVDAIRCSTKAGSGHPTSGMSAADITAVLAARHLNYDWENPKADNNDHLIFSKGHASPLIYALFKAVGVISDEELLTYRTIVSPLQGHPTPILPWVDIATGSLGQGLPVAVGIALAGKYLDKLPYHTWVICGDSEVAEGSVWEAFDKAAFYGLNNLTVIIDVNRLGQSRETEFGWNTNVYKNRVEAFGCRAIVINGHSIDEIDHALATASKEMEKPTVIIARTIKGQGFSEIANKDGWHGKALPPDMAERAIAELGGERNITFTSPLPKISIPVTTSEPKVAKIELPKYKIGDKVATRKAYGEAIAAMSANPKVVALDAEVSNSTFADDFKQVSPERFFEVWIAEQQLVSAAIGMSVRNYIPFASTFAAFFSRAYDFVRMGAISQANIRLTGSHSGSEIGADGPSQMALEDIAAMRAIHGSTVLYPSDATCCAALIQIMAETKGISYMRTTRNAYPVLYKNDEKFSIGGSKVLRQNVKDVAALIGAGVTLYNCLEAADQLAKDGILLRVIDLYSIKPTDIKTLRLAAKQCNGRLIIVEDHYPEGGIGAAVMEALANDPKPPRITHLAVSSLPGSGSSEDVMSQVGIDVKSIIKAVRETIGTRRNGK